MQHPGLYDALDALDWASVPLGHQAAETGHGRRERRTSQVMDAPEPIKAKFPHVRQVAFIERYVTRKVRKRKKNSRKYTTTQVRSAIAVFVITSLDACAVICVSCRPTSIPSSKIWKQAGGRAS